MCNAYIIPINLDSVYSFIVFNENKLLDFFLYGRKDCIFVK